MMLRALAPLAAAAALIAAPALAVTLMNKDSQPHQVQVVEGGQAKTVTVQPGQTMDGVCAAGCVMTLDANGLDETPPLTGAEIYAIQDGQFTNGQ